jgi:hypothetical protein
MKRLGIAVVVAGVVINIQARASELPSAKPEPSGVTKSSAAVPAKTGGARPVSKSAGGGGTGKELVVNGSFEYPRQEGGWRGMSAPSNDLYGWQVSSGNIDLFHVKDAPSGTQAVDLEGQEAGIIRQALRTVPGVTYDVSFCAGCHPVGGGTDKKFFFRAANQAKSWAFDCTGFDCTERLGWRKFDWQFTAHEPVTVLEIGSLRPNGTGSALIDAVSVVRAGRKRATKDGGAGESGASKGSSSGGTASSGGEKNLIVNGSFEQSPDPKSGWIHYALGSTAIYGWRVSLGDVDLWGGIKTPYGMKTIDLQGQQAGAVAQSIPTEVGATYRVKFNVGSYDNQSKKVYARAAGKKLIWPIEVSGSTERPLLAEVFFDFKARDTKTTIEIGSSTNGSQGPVIDNVSCVKTADPVKVESAPNAATPPPTKTDASAQPATTTSAAEEEEEEEEETPAATPTATPGTTPSATPAVAPPASAPAPQK